MLRFTLLKSSGLKAAIMTCSHFQGKRKPKVLWNRQLQTSSLSLAELLKESVIQVYLQDMNTMKQARVSFPNAMFKIFSRL